jgi:hypothetical protein
MRIVLQFVCLECDSVELAAQAALELVFNYWLHDFDSPELIISVMRCDEGNRPEQALEDEFQKMFALPIVDVSSAINVK